MVLYWCQSFQVSGLCREPVIGLTKELIYGILCAGEGRFSAIVKHENQGITDASVGQFSPHNELNTLGFGTQQMTLGIYCGFSIQA